MRADQPIDIPTLYKDLGKTESKAHSAHARLDRFEEGVKQDLVGIHKEMRAIRECVGGLTGWKNRVIGWSIAMTSVAGVLGAIFGMIFSHVLKIWVS